MATPPQQPLPPQAPQPTQQPPAPQEKPPQTAPQLSQILDHAPKFVALLAAFVYASGFLITSQYYAGFGFSDTNPFRPKIISAGVWFVLFAGIPAAIAARYLRTPTSTAPKPATAWKGFPKAFLSELLRPAPDALFYYISCAGITFAASPLFDLPPIDTFYFVSTIGAGIPLVFALALRLRFPFFSRTIAACTIAALITYYIVYRAKNPTLGLEAIQMALFASGAFWFIAIQNFKAFLLYTIPATLIATVSGFPVTFYSHIKSSWGGGSPVPVVLYLSKDSRILPGQYFQTKLVDETDGGYYILDNARKKAMFIPRKAVSLVYFSESLPDQALVDSVPVNNIKLLK